MNQNDLHDVLWIASEVCYYLGLILAALFVPLLAFALLMMSMAGKVEPNYWYLLLAWLLSVLMFVTGIGLKNRFYSKKE